MKDPRIPEGYNMDGYLELAAAVVKRAVRDYTRALRILKKKPNNKPAQWTVMECELFFRRNIGYYTEIDGEAIIRKVREMVEREERKKGL